MQRSRKLKFYSALGLAIALLLSATTRPFSTTAVAQSAQNLEWKNLTPSQEPMPQARRNGVAIYDPVEHRVIIFGGAGQDGLLNDTWAFSLNTLSWTQLNTLGDRPDPRLGHDAIYDPVGQQMVVWA